MKLSSSCSISWKSKQDKHQQGVRILNNMKIILYSNHNDSKKIDKQDKNVRLNQRKITQKYKQILMSQ